MWVLLAFPAGVHWPTRLLEGEGIEGDFRWLHVDDSYMIYEEHDFFFFTKGLSACKYQGYSIRVYVTV